MLKKIILMVIISCLEIIANSNFLMAINTVPSTEIDTKNIIKIADQEIDIIDVNDTKIDAKNHVNRYNGTFLYGHNTWEVFRSLYDVNAGHTFTITTDKKHDIRSRKDSYS